MITVGDWITILAVICVLSIAIPLWILAVYAVLTYRYNRNRHLEAEATRVSRKTSKQTDKRLERQQEIAGKILRFLGNLRSGKNLGKLTWGIDREVKEIRIYWNATNIHEIVIASSSQIRLVYPLRGGQFEYFHTGEVGLERLFKQLEQNLSELKIPA